MQSFDVDYDHVKHWFVLSDNGGQVIRHLKPDVRTRLDEYGLVSYSTRTKDNIRTARFVFMTMEGAVAARLMVSG